MLALTGTDAVFAASAVAFLLSALLLAGVRPEREAPRAPMKTGLLRESFAGFSTIARDSACASSSGSMGRRPSSRAR